MKTPLTIHVAVLCSLTAAPMLRAQGTAFTYQGRLTDGANPANGSYDLRFILYTGDPGGNQVGPILTNAATTVSSGLFVVTLDFGANVFTSASRFLEIAVRTNNVGGFTTLSARQKLTPAPYAIFAENVGIGGLAGTYTNAVTFNNAANSFSGSGAGLTGVNAATLGGFNASQFWKTTGNAGTSPPANFVGTTDNQAFELRVNGARALRLQPGNSSPNVIGGSSSNFVAAFASGVTIAGGGANSIAADSGTIGGGTSNVIETNAYESVIGGGSGNIIHTNANRSTIAGGVFHELLTDASYSFIGGGTRNKGASNAYHATISGGSNNTIDRDTSYGFIGGGKLHTISPQSAHATIAGGDGNVAGGKAPAIGGGTLNVIEPGTTYSTIAGGGGNRVTANSFSSTICGGYLNQVEGNLSFAAGNRAQANHPGTFAWAGGNTMPYASIFPYSVNLYASNGVSMDYGAQSAGQPRGSRYVYIGPFNAGNTISTWNGARLTDGGVWSNASDKNRKTDFRNVDARTVLEKVAALPVREWRYTNEDAGVKHLGPVAQDFRSAFGLGTDDKSIGTVDADGVALAAIQGLNQKLEAQITAQRTELQAKDNRIANLEQRLTKLEKVIQQAVQKRD